MDRNFESDGEYEEDIWADYYDDENQNEIEYKEERINWAKASLVNIMIDSGLYLVVWKFLTSPTQYSVAPDPSALGSVPTSIYCDLVSSLASRCAEFSLLEIWRYNPDLIRTVTDQEVRTIKK